MINTHQFSECLDICDSDMGRNLSMTMRGLLNMLRKIVIVFCVALFAFEIGSYIGYHYDWTYFYEETFCMDTSAEDMMKETENDVSAIDFAIAKTKSLEGYKYQVNSFYSEDYPEYAELYSISDAQIEIADRGVYYYTDGFAEFQYAHKPSHPKINIAYAGEKITIRYSHMQDKLPTQIISGQKKIRKEYDYRVSLAEILWKKVQNQKIIASTSMRSDKTTDPRQKQWVIDMDIQTFTHVMTEDTITMILPKEKGIYYYYVEIPLVEKSYPIYIHFYIDVK